MRCDRCTEAATHVAWDEPENEGALMFGDEVIGVALCDRCLAETLELGPWDGVEPLEAVAA